MITSGYRLKLGHSSCPQILYWNFEIYIIGSWKGFKTEIVLLSRNESPWHTICIAFNSFTLLSLKEMSLLHLHCLISSVLTFSIFIMLQISFYLEFHPLTCHKNVSPSEKINLKYCKCNTASNILTKQREAIPN